LRAAAAQSVWRDQAIETIFFGGGTPSLFAPESIATLLDAVRSLWRLSDPSIEITLEANPGTVDRAKLRGLRGAGINRLSFGVQSFHPDHLAKLGRMHSAAEAIDAIGAAREAGFANLNLDLIFGVPGQTLEEWSADLDTAVALSPDHISAYGLTYEEGTAFYAQQRSGRLRPIAEEIEVAMFTHTRTALAARGYAAYEISNFAQPGRACAHNLNYWRAGAYLGVGAGAHSFSLEPTPGRRWGNEKRPQRYIDRARSEGHARVSEESLGETQARGEFVFLGLRCSDGFAAAAFRRRFAVDFTRAFPHADAYVRDGLLELVDARWRLTARGLLLADSVFASFL